MLLTSLPQVQAKIAAGKHPVIWIWEEDEGNFCSFDPEGAEDGVQTPTILQLTGWALPTMLAGYINTGTSGLVLTALWGGFMFLNGFNDDDFIGTVGMENASTANPRAIVRQLSSTAPPSIRGWIWFETVP